MGQNIELMSAIFIYNGFRNSVLPIQCSLRGSILMFMTFTRVSAAVVVDVYNYYRVLTTRVSLRDLSNRSSGLNLD